MKQHFLHNKYIYILIILLFIAKLFFIVSYNDFSEAPDSWAFNHFVTELMNDNFNDYVGERTPGYPYVVYLLNHDKMAVVFTQLLMGIITAVFWFKTLVNLNFSQKVAFYVTLFSSLYVQNFFYETFILAENFYVVVKFDCVLFFNEQLLREETNCCRNCTECFIGDFNFGQAFFYFLSVLNICIISA